MKTLNVRTDDMVEVLGVPVFGGLLREVMERVERCVTGEGEKSLVVFTPNTEQLVMAYGDAAFRSMLTQSTVNVPDSVGVAWAGHLGRAMAGVDVAEQICSRAAQVGWKVFLVGGADNVAELAAGALRRRYSGLSIEGTQGSIDSAHETDAEWHTTLGRIREFGAQVVLVGFGAPKQEAWILAHRAELEEAGVRVMMVVGGALDMWAGKTPRAPLWVRRIGLEWLWRLILQPWRIGRQLRLLTFVWLVLRERFAI